MALAIIAVALAAAARHRPDGGQQPRPAGQGAGLIAAQNALVLLRLEQTLPAAGSRTQPCPQGGLRLECELVFTNSMNRSFRQVSVRVRDANARAAARWRSWTGCCRACDESAPPAAPSSASR